jgi:DNA-binding transcriptional LysR family regulator
MALAKAGHFARAAAACHVSQPTLSAAIQQLEAELGVLVVKRGQRFQGLTPQGQLVMEAAERMAHERDRLRRQLRDQRSQSMPILRIGVLGSTVPLLERFTRAFRERFPQVSLSITMQSPFDVQQAFDASAVDVAITYLDKGLRRHCRTHTLYTEQYDLLIRKGAEFSGRTSVSWDDLARLPLCLLSPDSPIFGKSESKVLARILATTPHIVTNAIWLVMDHVRTGQWASVLPKPVRIMVAGEKDLESIPLPALGKPNSVAIAIPNREPVSPLAEAFFEIAARNHDSGNVRPILDRDASGVSRSSTNKHRLHQYLKSKQTILQMSRSRI